MDIIATSLLLLATILYIIYLILDEKDSEKECQLCEQEEEKVCKSILITNRVGDVYLYTHSDNTFKDNMRIEITCDADNQIVFHIYIIIYGTVEIEGVALEKYVLSKKEYGYLILHDMTVVTIKLSKEDVVIMEQVNYISCLTKNNRHNVSIILSNKEKNVIKDMIAYYNFLI